MQLTAPAVPEEPPDRRRVEDYLPSSHPLGWVPFFGTVAMDSFCQKRLQDVGIMMMREDREMRFPMVGFSLSLGLAAGKDCRASTYVCGEGSRYFSGDDDDDDDGKVEAKSGTVVDLLCIQHRGSVDGILALSEHLPQVKT
nr:hypothetical protein CFP56_62859 [Quercus suber]